MPCTRLQPGVIWSSYPGLVWILEEMQNITEDQLFFPEAEKKWNLLLLSFFIVSHSTVVLSKHFFSALRSISGIWSLCLAYSEQYIFIEKFKQTKTECFFQHRDVSIWWLMLNRINVYSTFSLYLHKCIKYNILNTNNQNKGSSLESLQCSLGQFLYQGPESCTISTDS